MPERAKDADQPGTPEEKFDAFVVVTIEWFKKRAQHAQFFYNGFRICLVVLSAALPALIASGEFWHKRLFATVISVAIAILAGLNSQFRPGEQWRHHRSTQLTLLRLKRAYENGDIGKYENAFEKYFVDVEALLAAEANQYWAFRILEWKAQELKP